MNSFVWENPGVSAVVVDEGTLTTPVAGSEARSLL